MPYFYAELLYDKQRKNPRGNMIRRTGHIVKAENQINALHIIKKYGISYPWGSIDIIDYMFELLPEKHQTIQNRKNGQGGKIWYENKKGKLCYEKDKR